MRKMSAEEFGKDYEYEKAKRKQRKEDRNTRDKRRSGRDRWEAKPADE
jgi:hypothetical protein